jgi:hypothetical protein
MRVPRELRPLAKAAKAAGWTIAPTRKNHLRWTSPDGVLLFTPSSPSDHRGATNHRLRLRRAGVSV